MDQEPKISQCEHLSCKCNINLQEQHYCGEFCKDVEPSQDDMRCGCGHSNCDPVKQLGNVQTFEPTDS